MSDCPICGEAGGFHVATSRSYGFGHEMARARIPRELLLGKGWLRQENASGRTS